MSENTAMQIIDALESKFGIAIDFAKENAIPYAIDLVSRYQKYFIFKHSIGIALLLIGMILFGFMLHSSIKRASGDNVDLYTLFKIILSILAIVFLTIVFIIYAPTAITNIVKAIYIPEFLILELIGGR